MSVVYIITGTLRGVRECTGVREYARIAFKKHEDVDSVGVTRVWWEQRPTTKNAKHLARHYISKESFEDIYEQWVPCDWKQHTLLKLDDEGFATECVTSASA